MTQVTQGLREEVRNRIMARTGRRVRNLDIQLNAGQVVLHGQAGSYHVKQLAQEGLQEVLPSLRLQNAIEVA